MGLRWLCAERRGGAQHHGAAETGGCQGQRPIWAREHHAKPGFKELLTLILGQPPRGGVGTQDCSFTPKCILFPPHVHPIYILFYLTKKQLQHNMQVSISLGAA
jgi:hypothetical protein